MLNRILKLSILFILLLTGYNVASASFTISRPSTNNLGLVGHWTFDGKDMRNGVALDSTANGNNGNLVNIATSTFYSIGKIGQGFNFDGSNDYANMGDPASGVLDFGTADFTISAWVKTTVAKINTIVSKRGGGANVGYDFRVTTTAGNDNLGLYLKDADDVSFTIYSATVSILDDGQWHFVVVSAIRSGNATFYRDGVANGTSNITANSASLDTTQVFQVGASGTGSVFNGNIDDVRVYNRALSGGEIKQLYNQGVSKLNKTPTNVLTNGLIGHWTFDGGKVVNGVALDSSGNSNNGNLVDIATSTFYSIGKIGQGFNFDGTDDYVGVPRINNNEMSISAWFYKNANNFSTTQAAPIWGSYYWNADTQLQEGFDLRFGYLTSTCGAGTAGYHCLNLALVTTNGTTKTLKNSYVNFIPLSKNGTSTQEWFHTVATYNSTDGYQRVYVNGVLQDSDLHTAGNTIVPFTTTTGSACYVRNKQHIGTTCVNIGYFNGKIDDVRVYNRALSAGEVKMLYNMGR